MPKKTKVQELFAGLQNNLSANLCLSAVHDNDDARGDNSELSWKKMLSTNLPGRYKVGKGFVIDCEGNQSHNLDVIIYDSYYSPYVFNENGVLYIPAESVYAVAECKQNLDKAHIDYSAKKAASVRCLKRTSLPILQMNGTMVAKKPFPILAGVLTTKLDWKSGFGKPFENAIKSSQQVSPINFGCVLENGSFKVSDQPFGIATSQSDESLITFFINLVTDLQTLGNVPAIDLKAYYSQV